MADNWALLINKMLRIIWGLVLIRGQIFSRLLMLAVSRRRLRWMWYQYNPSLSNVLQFLVGGVLRLQMFVVYYCLQSVVLCQ